MTNKITIGIDIGTSNSCLCYLYNHNLQIIKDMGSHNISSSMSIVDNNIIFGNKTTLINDSNIFISNIKRLIGYKYSELNETYYNNFSFEITNDNDTIRIYNYTVDELIVLYFCYLKKIIEKEITDYDAIVTVPAYYNITQKNIIKNCAETAGIAVLKLLNEPTSAALAYGKHINIKNDGTILVFDLGGGTLDISILNISNDEDIYEVIYTWGHNIGGSDLTHKLIEYIQNKYNITNNNIFKYMDDAKIKLNNGENVVFQNITITVDEFNVIANDWSNIFITFLDNVCETAQIDKTKISNVFMVGGSSKLAAVRNIITSYFDKQLESFTIANAPIEDIAVAYGAAIHNDVNTNILLVDVCPFTIGIETKDGIMAPIINANSMIPVGNHKKFMTTEDYVDEIAIKIYQGESKLCCNNIFLGEFILSDIYKAPKGSVGIDISITIDTDGLLFVTAHDKFNNVSNDLTISLKNNYYSDDRLKEIRNKMFLNKDEDDLICSMLESYNRLIIDYEHLCFNILNNIMIQMDESKIREIKDSIKSYIENILAYIYDQNNKYKFDSFKILTSELFNEEPFNISNVSYNVNDLKKSFELFHTFLLQTYPILLTFTHDAYDKKDIAIVNLENNIAGEFAEYIESVIDENSENNELLMYISEIQDLIDEKITIEIIESVKEKIKSFINV